METSTEDESPLEALHVIISKIVKMESDLTQKIEDKIKFIIPIVIFLLLVFRTFFETFGNENANSVYLNSAALITLYLIVYVLFDYGKNNLHDYLGIKVWINHLLNINLIIIALIIPYLGLVDKLNNILTTNIKQVLACLFNAAVWSLVLIPLIILFLVCFIIFQNFRKSFNKNNYEKSISLTKLKVAKKNPAVKKEIKVFKNITGDLIKKILYSLIVALLIWFFILPCSLFDKKIIMEFLLLLSFVFICVEGLFLYSNRPDKAVGYRRYLFDILAPLLAAWWILFQVYIHFFP